ncbi:MaoC family dehydratase [Saccharothrix variisporea]|uniref:Acyl dehydratase n=1 Tax=Saccharothrix variisporea TaxID=543527 RepID=A0A495XPQ5_9PSEU|nr:MaoC/PaaZ C-terminal domain-containing protein [Saccharothrix variisporea]RKT74433.1 acyl dehydratase [Saccharothrix variisporea]
MAHRSPRGMYFEDFEVGWQLDSATRPLTGEVLREFADLTGDRNPLHSAETSGDGGFGRPIAHGVLGMALAIGLIEETGVHEGTTIAMVGLTDWRFRHPVFVGDVLSAHMTVVAKRVSTTDPARGVLTRRLELRNHARVVVQDGTTVLLVRRRPSSGRWPWTRGRPLTADLGPTDAEQPAGQHARPQRPEVP